MRRLLILGFILLIAGAIYLFIPKNKPPQPPPAEPTASILQPTPQPGPPRRAPVRTAPDGSVDTRAPALNEAPLIQRLRDNVRTNPALAEALAREDRRRSPDSPDSDERDALLVDALINQQRIGAARSETYYYLDHHPNGRFAEHLFIMTGVHPMPKGPGQP
jgi:hypothetical protein